MPTAWSARAGQAAHKGSGGWEIDSRWVPLCSQKSFRRIGCPCPADVGAVGGSVKSMGHGVRRGRSTRRKTGTGEVSVSASFADFGVVGTCHMRKALAEGMEVLAEEREVLGLGTARAPARPTRASP